MACRRETQSVAANRFKVDQSRVNRVLKGDFTHRSDLARRMQLYYLPDAQVDEENAHNSDASRAFQGVVSALENLWDGTAEGALRLRGLVEAARWLRNER